MSLPRLRLCWVRLLLFLLSNCLLSFQNTSQSVIYLIDSFKTIFILDCGTPKFKGFLYVHFDIPTKKSNLFKNYQVYCFLCHLRRLRVFLYLTAELNFPQQKTVSEVGRLYDKS